MSMDTYAPHGGFGSKASVSNLWQAEELALHRKRIHFPHARVDHTTPHSYYVVVNKGKKELSKEETHSRIERENTILANRIASLRSDIFGEPVNHRPPSVLHHGELKRYREQKRIYEENINIIKRVNDQRPTYSSKVWEEHSKKHYELMNNLRELSRSHTSAELLHYHQYAKQKTSLAQTAPKLESIYSGDQAKPGSPYQKRCATAAVTSSKTNNRKNDLLLNTLVTSEETKSDSSTNYQTNFPPISPSQFSRRQNEGPPSTAPTASSTLSVIIPSDSPAISAASPQRSGTTNNSSPSKGSIYSQILQEGRTVNDRHIIITVDNIEANQNVVKSHAPIGLPNQYNFSPSTVPRQLLQCFLFRAYDLDTTEHSHLYIPYDLVSRIHEKADPSIPIIDSNFTVEELKNVVRQLMSMLVWKMGRQLNLKIKEPIVENAIVKRLSALGKQRHSESTTVQRETSKSMVKRFSTFHSGMKGHNKSTPAGRQTRHLPSAGPNSTGTSKRNSSKFSISSVNASHRSSRLPTLKSRSSITEEENNHQLELPSNNRNSYSSSKRSSARQSSRSKKSSAAGSHCPSQRSARFNESGEELGNNGRIDEEKLNGKTLEEFNENEVAEESKSRQIEPSGLRSDDDEYSDDEDIGDYSSTESFIKACMRTDFKSFHGARSPVARPENSLSAPPASTADFVLACEIADSILANANSARLRQN